MNKTTLQHLAQGQSAVVKSLLSPDGMRRRLLDIGLIHGTNVTCLQKSNTGDPAAYLIRGAVIALRKEDAGQIIIEHMH